MNLFNVSLQLKGFDINQSKRELRRIQGLSVEQFIAFQKAKRNEIYQYHVKHSAAYRDFVIRRRGYFPTEWDKIPVLKKKDIQIPIDSRLSDEFATKDVRIHSTSGSTGQPFYFAKDKFCHSMTWASILDRYGKHGIRYGDSKQARFYGIPLGFPGYQKERLKDVLSNRYRFTVFDLSDRILASFLEKFKKAKFEYINGYTSSLVLFCEFLIREGVVLKDVCPSLKVVFPTSEMCSQGEREVIEKATGVKVANEYGAAELDVIAFEDENFDWILNEENLYVEILDDNNKVVPNGEPGRVIITSLFNSANAFIRYEVGDVGTIAKDKKGIYRVLENLIGRTNDFIVLPSGDKSPGLTFYYISKSLFEHGGFMKEFVIKQKTPSTFHFEYVANREIEEAEKTAVFKAMEEYLAPNLNATFEKKDVIARTAAGKIKHFFREF